MFKTALSAIIFAGVGLAAILVILILIVVLRGEARAQSNVPCKPVPNGAAFTILCANGYFHSTMPDGTVVEGNGMSDPTATNPGSRIPLDDRGNIINRGMVEPPPPNQQNAAPGQWYYFGGLPPQ